MLRLLKDIWKNLYARSALLLFLVLIVFASIFQLRFKIFNFFNRLTLGESFDDPLSQQKKPYAFREDPKTAQAKLVKGLEELLEYTSKLYAWPKENITINQAASLDNNYTHYLNKEEAELLKILVKDLSLFCQPLTSRDDPWHNWQREKQLNRRHRRVAQAGEINPFDYALTEKNYPPVVKKILEIDRENFFVALQKKPDARAVLELREELYRALCRGYETPKFWQRAIEYKEYLAEQKIYHSLESTKQKYYPDEIARSAWVELARDKNYHEYLKEFFVRMRSYSGDIEMQLEQAMTLYITTRDPYYLMTYIALLLENSRTGGVSRAQKSFEILLAMQKQEIATEPIYLYALAETAYRMGDLYKARALVNQLLKKATELKILKETKRLDFILQMSGV